jgi:UPF0716 protein FxsA
MIFLTIFVIIPFIEILLFMSIGAKIGMMTTLLLAFLTAVIGGSIVRQQGLHTLKAIQLSVDRGQIPLDELFDGICLIIAGATLITPGFLTDTIGFLLLIPAFRNIVRYGLRKHTKFGVETFGPDFQAPPRGQGYTQTPPQDIIEGDYERLDEDERS